ncbi:MAG: hypothetical protein KIT62_08235 [Cyclobacteriaceae bacterium]|nr:hypothetical protein [Cyclobacteriaceae bacterium]
MMKAAGLIFFCCFISFAVFPQTDFVKLKSWKAKNTELITVDRLGNFIFKEKTGKLLKYDADGKKSAASARQSITLVEPWFQPSIFVYNREKQQYHLWNRNFESETAYQVDAAWAVEPWLVCPTHDNRLWILDRADWSLKKVLPVSGEVIQEFSLGTEETGNANFIYLREYLNLVFLLDTRSGILIYNHLGKLIEKIHAPGLTSFYFFGDELYFLQDDKLKYFNLLTSQWREHSIPANTRQAIITDERLMVLNQQKQAVLYRYNPGL